jgi:hypothetical protein
MRNKVSDDNELGKKLLSNEQLGKRISSLSWVVGGLTLAVVATSAVSFANNKDKPLLLYNGVVLTEYKSVLENLTEAERALIAKSTYEGLRRRTGIAKVDGEQVGAWLSNITPNGVKAWQATGDRWKKINFVQPGFSRAVRVLSTQPDLVTPYAFTINAIETEAEVGKPLANKSYNVRLTLFFTDPEKGNGFMLDGIALHNEEETK